MKKKLVATLITGNDTARHLRQVLTHLQTYVDGLVILDDGSTDETEEICLSQPKLISFYKRPAPGFARDASLVRRELWEMVDVVAPDWVLAMEADEIMEDGIRQELPQLLNQSRFGAVRFPVCHFWGNQQYVRVDKWWSPQKNYELLLFRHCPGAHRDTTSWSGRHPIEVLTYPTRFSHIRLRHYGWADTKAAGTRTEPAFGQGETWGLYNDKAPTLRRWPDLHFPG